MQRFPLPVEVFEALSEVDKTDLEYGVYRFSAKGITSRGSSDRVFDVDGTSMSWLSNTYHADAEIEAELNAIAASYHAMRDALQAQWTAALKKASKLGVVTLDVEMR